MIMLDKGCYQFESMQMRYAIDRLVKQETHLEYFHLCSFRKSSSTARQTAFSDPVG